MNLENKPRGGSAGTPLGAFKELWRHSLDDSAKDYWRSRFSSASLTQAQIRAEIKAKLKLDLKSDSQLTIFRQWVDQQDAMDAEAATQAAEEAHLRELHPEWDAEALRTAVIAGTYRRALTKGDFELGLKAVREDRGLMDTKMDAEKFKASLKTKVDLGLDEIAELFKRAPALLAEFNALRAKLTKDISA